MNESLEIIKNLDWSPLIISIKTAIVATIISFFIGVLLAKKAMTCNKKKKAFLDGIMSLPIVLPPTVAGFILLIVFSKRRFLGSFLLDNFNISVLQTWLGCILAATVIALPLMYQNARAAFEQVDENLIYAARTLGMSERKIFYRILLPVARPGLIAGSILCFARAMGEYGATSMIAGNIPGKTGTISQTIAMVINDGDYLKAGIWVVIVLMISFVIIYSVNVTLSKK
ncbi:MAG: molybdate ABC transporter permease subunit [Peptostreptococcus porci]|uniref:Molybdenum transport system permease n=1 Tax=Peptostreptococcus porci TaxID=2652282 RepID=A0A6N7XDK7_9FIRM|nr:molybdate ABC transporter permease subunit [Peptostreptococcus porci]MDD7182172.1 molybdate ABC transporter permease subunit [Peptostreptococcus porci]MDY2795232.1 molybdate ABC transporter permease subunit [Peptostreptococcus porci]MDY4128381.1 molybdate ABC transporter permease subunit [Peptostreptococcus porci]MDY5480757.1 molybdate ABC transporter permease subunit [Peptostreptococcus porci]MDY5964825.1 molybdate ABC transporter permease subunit [Peptostreptococcus porci]